MERSLLAEKINALLVIYDLDSLRYSPAMVYLAKRSFACAAMFKDAENIK